MTLKIGDKALIPAPIVTINKELSFTDDGRPLLPLFRINLKGTLLPERGSPTSEGWHIGDGEPADEIFNADDQKHFSLLSKQEFLRDALAEPGFRLRYCPQGYECIDAYPKFINLTFDPGTWVIKSDYSIDLESIYLNQQLTSEIEDSLVLNTSGLYLTRVSDDFRISEREDGTLLKDIIRTISATATTAYTSGVVSGTTTLSGIIGNEAWRNAKSWVNYRINNYPLGSGDTRFAIPSGANTFYNIFAEETIDKTAGTYSVVQHHIYHTANYSENRNVSKTRESITVGDEGPVIESISVNGTVQGLASGTNLSATKLANALTYFYSITGTLHTQVGAFGLPLTLTWGSDETNGVINYTATFINNSGSTYRHTYDVNFTFDSQQYPQVQIAGQIEGITNDGIYSNSSGHKFNRAVSGWTTLSSTLKSLAFAYSNIFGGVSYGNNFSDIPLNKRVSFNKAVGTISYDYLFSFNDAGSSAEYSDEYTIDLNTPNSTTIGSRAGLLVNATINGTIKGLDSSDTPSNRYTAAATAWSTIQTQLLSRVNTEYSKIGSNTPSLNSGILSKTIGLNKQAGIITYSASFSNYPYPSNSGIAVEDVSVEDAYPQDIFAVQIIPGRSLGPIIQNMGTINELRRNINISLTMYPKAGTSHWAYSDKPTLKTVSSGILNNLLPPGIKGTGWFVAGDSDNWDWKNGFYTRSINIVYPTGG